MNMRNSAHQENMLSAAIAAASSAKRSEELLRQLVAKDRAAVLSEWTDRDMSVGNVIYKAGAITIADILDHAACEARKDQGETSTVHDDDAEWLRRIAKDCRNGHARQRRSADRLERIASRLSPSTAEVLRPQGCAGDAIDFACGHCAPDEAIAFLDDWRMDRADEWPGYMKWLDFQRECAAAAKARAALVGKSGEGV